MIDSYVESIARGHRIASDGSEWHVIRRGDGLITGYLEVRASRGRYMTVPGATRFIAGPDLDVKLATICYEARSGA